MTAPGPAPERWPPDWLGDAATQRLIAAFAAAGLELRFVGGAVRDALLGLPGGDIDAATPAPPDAVIAALAAAAIKWVPTGLAHGTVTAVVGKRHFEITTLRRDVETDGRHAVVAFGADWAADAARRDFTINAIYLDPGGALYDPVGGRADLAAGRVRFVGDPARRIAEDVLRLLRYYRFEARYGTGAGDAAARAACRAAVPLLPSLSAERVAHEVFALLAAADPIRALRLMQEDGVLAAILPEAACIERLQRLMGVEAAIVGGADALLRLAALVAVDRSGAVGLAERLRLAVADRKRLAGLAQPWPFDPAGDDRAQRRARYRLGAERFRDLAALAAAAGGMTEPGLAEMAALAAWTPPVFPVSGDDVTVQGIPPGPAVGRVLARLRRWWEEGDFAADRAQCFAVLAELVREELGASASGTAPAVRR